MFHRCSGILQLTFLLSLTSNDFNLDLSFKLDRGKLYCYEANYSRYLALKAERLEMAEAAGIETKGPMF